MKQKANDTMDAAQTLLNNKQATASIHCSYYAVLQYMKYMLANTDKDPIPYTKQVAETDSSSSSHQFLIEEIQNRISNKDLRRQFNDGIRVLKRARIEADYTEKEFSLELGLMYKQNAQGLITKLKTNFGNI